MKHNPPFFISLFFSRFVICCFLLLSFLATSYSLAATPTASWEFRRANSGLIEARSNSSDPSWTGTIAATKFDDTDAKFFCEKIFNAPSNSKFFYSGANPNPSSHSKVLSSVDCPPTADSFSDCDVIEYPSASSTNYVPVVSIWCDLRDEVVEFYLNESYGKTPNNNNNNNNNQNMVLARPAVKQGQPVPKWYPVVFSNSASGIANPDTPVNFLCREISPSKMWKAATSNTFTSTTQPRNWLFKSPVFNYTTKALIAVGNHFPTAAQSDFWSINCQNPEWYVERANDGTIYISDNACVEPPSGVCYSNSDVNHINQYDIDLNGAKTLCKMLGKGSNDVKLQSVLFGAAPSGTKKYSNIKCPANAQTLNDCSFWSQYQYCSGYLQLACDGESFPLAGVSQQQNREFKLDPSTNSNDHGQLLVLTRDTSSSSSWSTICRRSNGNSYFANFLCHSNNLPYGSSGSLGGTANYSSVVDPPTFKHFVCNPPRDSSANPSLNQRLPLTDPRTQCGFVENTTWCTASTSYRIYCYGEISDTPIEWRVGGDANSNEGLLQVKFATDDEFGYVAYTQNNNINYNTTAMNVCGKLGKPMTEAFMTFETNDDYPTRTAQFPLDTIADNLYCSTTMRNLSKCSIRYRGALSAAAKKTVLKIHCRGDYFFDFQFKLNETNKLAVLSKVSHNASWGTVNWLALLKNRFNNYDSTTKRYPTAQNMCRWLHNNKTSKYAKFFNYSNDNASMKIALTDLECSPNRASSTAASPGDLADCRWTRGCGAPTAPQLCGTDHNVGIHCRDSFVLNARLVPSSSSSSSSSNDFYQNMKVELRVNDEEWKGVCSGYSDIKLAKSLCYTQGYPSSQATMSYTTITTATSSTTDAPLGFSQLYCPTEFTNINGSIDDTQCTVEEDLTGNGCVPGRQMTVTCAGDVVNKWSARARPSDDNQIELQYGLFGEWQTVCPPADLSTLSFYTMWSLCYAMGNLSANSPVARSIPVSSTTSMTKPSINSVSCSSTSYQQGFIDTTKCTIDNFTAHCDKSHSLALWCDGSQAPPTPESTPAPPTNEGTNPEYRISQLPGTNDFHRLEVKLPGEDDWGSVCNQEAGGSEDSSSSTLPTFDSAFATRLCQQKIYPNDAAAYVRGFYWSDPSKKPDPSANMKVKITNVKCPSGSGSSGSIESCSYDKYSAVSHPRCANHERDVFIFCSQNQRSIDGFDVKLAGDHRVLVKPLGAGTIQQKLPWGSVGCLITSWSEGFNKQMIDPSTSSAYDSFAQVVCRAVGYAVDDDVVESARTIQISSNDRTNYEMPLPMWGSQFYKCPENATRLNECQYSLNTCGSHSSDVFVSCGNKLSYAAGHFFELDASKNNLVRIRPANSSLPWGTFDASTANSQALNAMCVALSGMANTNYRVYSTTKSSSSTTNNDGPSYLKNLQCSSGELLLGGNCQFDSSPSSSSSDSQSSLFCDPPNSALPAVNGGWSLRLTGADNRLEVKAPGNTSSQWSVFCFHGTSWSRQLAQRMCQFMGFSAGSSLITKATITSIPKTNEFMPYYTYLYCSPSSTSFADCTLNNYTSSYYTEQCPYTAVSLNCIAGEVDLSPSAAAAGNDPNVTSPITDDGSNDKKFPLVLVAAAAGGAVAFIVIIVIGISCRNSGKAKRQGGAQSDLDGQQHVYHNQEINGAEIERDVQMFALNDNNNNGNNYHNQNLVL